VLSTTPAAPTGLTVTESLYRVKDQALVLIQAGWEQVFGALEYQVTYRVNGGNTVTLPKSPAPIWKSETLSPATMSSRCGLWGRRASWATPQA
jgi:hypothetical protein